MSYFSDNGINKFYAYREKPRGQKVIEFGWIPVRFLQSGKPFVTSRSESSPEEDNAATLEDYDKYFTKLTKSTPSEFLARWSEKQEDLGRYWQDTMPHTEPGTHEFILKLAELISNKKSFTHNFSKRLTHFEVVDVEFEKSGSSPGNESREVSK